MPQSRVARLQERIVLYIRQMRDPRKAEERSGDGG
jgi:hypothetical protein